MTTQAKLIALAVVALVIAGLAAWGLWWRGEAMQARGERDVAIAQANVLADGLKVCNAGVDQAKRVGDAAVAATAELVKAAQRIKRPAKETVITVEKWLEQPTPKGEDCRHAWARIEAEMAAQKARAPK